MSKIKVIIVDDSIVFRTALEKRLSEDPYIEVVATAVDAFDARDKILKHKCDVITCDVEMPKMNGIEFIKRLIPQYPIPVIVVSTISNAVFDAMNAGAVDFVTKPSEPTEKSVEAFHKELISKIKVATVSKVVNHNIKTDNNFAKKKTNKNIDIIAIGASTGGPEAISYLLSQLPSYLPGIVVVQHMPPVYTKLFADRLNGQVGLEVKEAESGDIVEPGKVFIAPGNKHMVVKYVGGNYIIKCFDGEKVNWSRPSVDVLFKSVAEEAKNRALGIILTGMGNDGAEGLLLMKKKGAVTIGQDEDSSVVYGMPKVAFDRDAVMKQAPLSSIPGIILKTIK